MKKYALPVIVVLALTLVGLGIYAGQDNSSDNTSETTQTEEIVNQQTLNISEDGRTVSYDGVAGEDALTTLLSLGTAETESSEFGEFVTSIEGVEADSSSEFWAFYVNGAQASVGADSYVAQEGDKIEWTLESFQ